MNRVDTIKSLFKTSPGDSFLQHALALEYIKEGNDPDARKLFESVLKEEPSYIGSYYHLGKLLERNGDVNAALYWYHKGMDIAQALQNNRAYNELQSAWEELHYG